MVVVVSSLLYKVACLLTGSLFGFLGYRLFVSGIWGNAGDLDSKFKDGKLVLKNAAPGTFFAVLGAAVVIVAVLQGMNLSSNDSRGDTIATPDGSLTSTTTTSDCLGGGSSATGTTATPGSATTR